jgi:squalene-hopene/tetraprenyl-beta-curcumene cyclase
MLAAGWLSQRVAPAPGGGSRVPGFLLPTWSTAFHLRALLHAGVPASEPRLARGLSWLLQTQQRRPQAALNQPDARAPRVGGWAFDPDNHTMPDCDDTGAVLSVLSMARQAPGGAPPPRLAAAIDAAASRAEAWLRGMQNPDGGWSAYVHGLPPKPPGPAMREPFVMSSKPAAVLRLLVDPPPALSDPSTEDVTARVLHGLAGFGATSRRPDVRRALAFLIRHQCADGSFWGRWLMNHLAGSSYVLQAARAVGESLGSPWVNRTVGWVLERQNRDGSWGETPASYRDPSLAGHGEGMAPLTALVVNGLCAIGFRRHPSVCKAVAYLLARQQSDGGWPEDGYIVPLLLPDTFYSHPEARLYYPLEALARFLGSPFA